MRLKMRQLFLSLFRNNVEIKLHLKGEQPLTLTVSTQGRKLIATLVYRLTMLIMLLFVIYLQHELVVSMHERHENAAHAETVNI